ncbi:hypothetical protein D3C80_1782600 [compost metagenome]
MSYAQFPLRNTGLLFHCPVSIAEYRLYRSIGQLSIDFQLSGADHEVDVGETDISAFFKQLLFG